MFACDRCFGAPASVGAPLDGALPIGDLRALRSGVRLQTAIIKAIPLKLSDVEFEDAQELALRMLAESLVPVPSVVAGVAALASTSEREGRVMEFAKSHVNDRAFRDVGPRLRLAAFVAGVEGRALRADDIPGAVNDPTTLSVVDALRRCDPQLLEEAMDSLGDLSARTLFELGFDVVSLPVPPDEDLSWAIGALAVQAKAWRCAYAESNAGSAYLYAVLKGFGDVADELADAVPELARLREYHRTRGTCFWLTPWFEPSCDLLLALAHDEEGVEDGFAWRSAPSSLVDFAEEFLARPPALRRKMRLSKLYPGELFELLEVAVREPTRVLKWIIDNLERPLPWEGIAELFSDRAFWTVMVSVLDRQSLDGVDLAKATAVLPRLDWQDEVTTDVVIAFARAGRDDSAADVLRAAPGRPRNCDRIAAHALLTGCLRTLASLIDGRDEWFVMGIACEAAKLLQCAGQPQAALFLAQLGGESGDDGSVWEGDETGRRLAEKLCAAAGLPDPVEIIRRRARVADARE
jgi:hypothetical protein